MCAELADHSFPDVRTTRHVVDVDDVEGQSGGLKTCVVTGDAVLIEEGAGGGVRRCGLLGRRVRSVSGRGDDHHPSGD